MLIAYLVHDLNDPAVSRRVTQFREGGAVVRLAGFWRGVEAPASVAGLSPVSLARTQDAKLLARGGAVLRRLVGPQALCELVRHADVIVARNLEMLVLAHWARALCRRQAPIVYESLDIHRSLLGAGISSRLLRGLERYLLRRSSLLVVSSPAFLTAYFQPRLGHLGRTLLIENKVAASEAPAPLDPKAARRPAGPPWRIGWFGALRCSRSLELLSQLVRDSDGRLEVVLRGRPALSEFSAFYEDVQRTPGLQFLGPYRREDLEGIYADVHFSWVIDFFEEGFNSAWLLPNRLYEGSLFGAVPLAMNGVETATWLRKRKAGVALGDPLTELVPLLRDLSPAAYLALREAVLRIPIGDLVTDSTEETQIVATLKGLPA